MSRVAWGAVLGSVLTNAMQVLPVLSGRELRGPDLQLPEAAPSAGAERGWPAGPQRPRRAGCYVWLPDGCRKQLFNATVNWRHDAWGEENMQASDSNEACVARNHAFDIWCGVNNTVMLHVAPSAQDVERGLDVHTPAEAGEGEEQFDEADHFRKGAPVAPEMPEAWESEADLPGKNTLLIARGEGTGNWLQIEVSGSLPMDAPRLPSSPGCFVWLNSGCRRQHFAAKEHWKRDVWGESNMQAGASKAACMDRKRAFDGWCGVKDAVMLLLLPASPDEAPTPSEAQHVGEPKQPQATQRRMPLEQFNDSSAVPERPRKAGCYVWLPDGCKKQHFKAKLHWRHDAWGEENMQPLESNDACVARKHAFDMWCGVINAVMLHVAPSDQDSVEGLAGHAPVESGEAVDQFEEGGGRTYED